MARRALICCYICCPTLEKTWGDGLPFQLHSSNSHVARERDDTLISSLIASIFKLCISASVTRWKWRAARKEGEEAQCRKLFYEDSCGSYVKKMKYFQSKSALPSDFDRRWAFISRNLIRSFNKTNHKMHFNCSRTNADLVASPPQGPHCGNELLDIGAVFDILQQDSVKGLRAPVNAWIAYRCQEAVARGYHDAVLLLLQKLLEISGQKGSGAALQRD